MRVIDKLFSAPQYSLVNTQKQTLLVEELCNITEFHRKNCEPYRKMLEVLNLPGVQEGDALADIPFLPVRLFKTMKLQSIADSDVIRVLTSSGTTSQQVSRIAVDKETSLLQTKTLASIVTSFIGPKRLPMIIIDSKVTLQNKTALNARGAGLVGLSNFGRDHYYALDDQMKLNISGLEGFIGKHSGENILIFGFTYMVWQYFYKELQRNGVVLPLNQAVVIHGGGWKRLEEAAVSNKSLKEGLKEQCGIDRVHNFYGMVEQVGSIFMECEQGYLHAPNFSEVLTRNFGDWGLLPPGEVGIIQTLSVLPRSYPGHSLLTDDLGAIHGVDDCPCGRKGTYFSVHGRVQKAGLRGCSDTHAYGVIQKTKDSQNSVTQFLPVFEEGTSLEKLTASVFFTKKPLTSFNEKVIDFFSDISQTIFKIPEVKEYPELVALAYWLRKSNIAKLVSAFLQTVGKNELIMPRGIAFHVAPSNVDTIFLYSWALSFLTGNLNIIRISQKMTPQLSALVNAVRKVMDKPEWQELAECNLVISYPRHADINLFFSGRADIRILWGGDETVQSFRILPAKPATKDIVFTDKVSCCLVNSERYLLIDDKKAADTAHLFYNDAYQFDQMACSSPRIVYFLGSPLLCEQASRRFWNTLSVELDQRKQSDGLSMALDKLAFSYQMAAHLKNAVLPYRWESVLPTVMRVPVSEIHECRTTSGGGFFFECFIENIEELALVILPNDQTLSYVEFSREEMQKVGSLLCMKGINRVVPIGQSLAFSPVWDGYSLFNELTQRVQVL